MSYNFLSDKPKGIDSFQSQAHTKIAAAITEVIKEDKIKLIGLEGEWGSGKSNIIKLLEKKLGKNEYIFYTYDTWGHQEDLQRRSFLENLTEVMKINFNNEEWSNKLNSLLATTKKTEQKEIPRFSKIAIFISVILYLNFKINLSDISKIEGFWNKLCYEIFQNNILALIGIVVIFCIYLLKVLKKGEKINFEDLLYIYKGKTLNTDYETIISTKEPTVRKFKEWIKDVSKTLKQKNKKMIIVYDNIDRLHSEKVKEVWSSIHTFFSECEYENITVIIPFSEKHILKALETAEETNIDFNEGVIEKTFSVVYSVTPPVLTDWKKYFNENLKEIFPDIEDNEKNIIRTLYDKKIKNITPRGVKNFINELRVFNSIYENIELRYIALFLLIKKDIQKDVSNYFWSDDFSKYKRILGNDADKKILALYFGVNEEAAVQVLLERDMKEVLEQGNSSTIDNMAQISGFNEILERVIFNLSDDEEIDKNYKNILNALVNRESNFNILKLIFESFMRKEKYFSFENYHKILLEKYPQKEKEIIEKLFNIQFYDKDNKEENYTEYLCNQFKEFEEYVENKGYNFKEYIKSRNYDPVIFFKLIEEFKIKYEYYGIDFIPEELENYLILNLRSFREKDMENLNILMSKFDFPKLKKELTLRIQKDEENKVNKNEYKVFTGFLIKEKKDLSELEQEFNMEFLYNKVKNFENNNSNTREEKIYVLSLMIAITSLNVSKISYLSSYILDSTSEEEINRIEKILVNYLEIDKLFIMLSSHYSNRNLTKNIIKIIIENKNVKYLDLENLIKNYNKIKVLIPNEMKKEFFELVDGFYNNNLNFDYKTIPTDLNLINLIIDSNEYNLPFTEYLKNLCVEYFNNEKESDYLYIECANQNYTLLNILDTIIDDFKIQLNNSIVNSFEKVLIGIVDGNISLTEKNKNILKKIEEKLTKGQLENIINIDIKDKILEKNYLEYEKCKFFYEIFMKTKFFYFDEMDKDNPSKRESYNRLIKIIIKPYIIYEECYTFIINCKEFIKGLKILKDYNGDFINELEQNQKYKEILTEIRGE